MLIKSERFELEMIGWNYLQWFRIDLRAKRYTLYRDLDWKLTWEVIDRPEPEHVRRERYFAELEAVERMSEEDRAAWYRDRLEA